MGGLEEKGFGIGLNEHAFIWGAQGPDFLFSHRYLPWQKGESLEPLGGRLHEEPPSRTLRPYGGIYRLGSMLSCCVPMSTALSAIMF